MVQHESFLDGRAHFVCLCTEQMIIVTFYDCSMTAWTRCNKSHITYKRRHDTWWCARATLKNGEREGSRMIKTTGKFVLMDTKNILFAWYHDEHNPRMTCILSWPDEHAIRAKHNGRSLAHYASLIFQTKNFLKEWRYKESNAIAQATNRPRSELCRKTALPQYH